MCLWWRPTCRPALEFQCFQSTSAKISRPPSHCVTLLISQAHPPTVHTILAVYAILHSFTAYLFCAVKLYDRRFLADSQECCSKTGVKLVTGIVLWCRVDLSVITREIRTNASIIAEISKSNLVIVTSILWALVMPAGPLVATSGGGGYVSWWRRAGVSINNSLFAINFRQPGNVPLSVFTVIGQFQCIWANKTF